MEQQDREQRALLRAAELEGLPAREHLQWAEDPEIHAVSGSADPIPHSRV